MRILKVVLSLLVLALPAGVSAQEPYDLVIRNGRVLDGTGTSWYRADVAIRGDRIAAVGRVGDAPARRVIDARDRYVTPGFIDAHSHAGPGLATPGLSEGRPLLAQGITTVFVNPDGGGPTDLVAQRRDLSKDGLGPNVALLVPHGSVHAAVMGMSDRLPTPADMERMKALVRAGMEAGAFGLSSGLFYAPGSYATTEEVVELAKVAAPYGGVYTSHIRDEADYTVGVVASVDEVIRVAREAGVPGIVTHIKVLGPRVWGYSAALVKRIERAREEGVQVWADQYPYTASQTGLTAALIPRWAEVGGQEALTQRLRDPEVWPRIRAEMVENLDRRGGADRIQFTRFEPDPSIEGKTLQAVADARGVDPLEAARDISAQGEAGIVSFNMDPADVRVLMSQPWTFTCTDGDLVPMGEGVPHPRGYGAFARKIQQYVVEEQVLDLATAVRSMTYTPATVLGAADRGILRPGAYADVLVFDPERLQDVATYTNPHQLAKGMDWVIVNGKVALDDGQFTDVRSGVVLSQLRGPLTR
ncbi:MAG TPA: D-aminoacylase [Longimicrobiales bacterium]|nr:D-aminoacylase [Longimicrobiales bacterium]